MFPFGRLATYTLAFGLSFSVQAEMYKCMENGKATFQDKPCAASGSSVTIRPANGEVSIPTSSSESSNDAKVQPTASERTRNDVKAMEKSRHQREIEYAIVRFDRQIADDRASMEAALAGLQQKKARAKNNLAGATWEQSISTEMQAVSEKYKINIWIAQDRIAELRRDLADLKSR